MGNARRKVIAYDSRFMSVNSKSTETLPDYVRRVRTEKRLSTVDVERQSGNRISDSYVTRIENGYVKNVSPEKLKALAKGLGVSEDEIFAVARGKSPAEEPDYKNWKFASLFDDAQKLTPEQMKEFEHLMEITRREVQRMLQEHAQASANSSGASRRSRKG
jgi:transcriptional regulator with XRE-family HTH domain